MLSLFMQTRVTPEPHQRSFPLQKIKVITEKPQLVIMQRTTDPRSPAKLDTSPTPLLLLWLKQQTKEKAEKLYDQKKR